MGSIIGILIFWGLIYILKSYLFPKTIEEKNEYEQPHILHKYSKFSFKNKKTRAYNKLWEYGDFQIKLDSEKANCLNCNKCNLIFWNKNNSKKLLCSSCGNKLTKDNNSSIADAFVFTAKGLVIPLDKQPLNKMLWTVYIYDITNNEDREFEHESFLFSSLGIENKNYQLNGKSFETEQNIFTNTVPIFKNAKLTQDSVITDWAKFGLVYKNQFKHPFSGKRKILFKSFLTTEAPEFNNSKIVNNDHIIRKIDFKTEIIFNDMGYLDKNFSKRIFYRVYIKNCINLVKVCFDINEKTIDKILYPLKQWIGLKLEEIIYNEFQNEIDERDDGYDLADINIEIEKKYFSTYLENTFLEKDNKFKFYQILYKILLDFSGNDRELSESIEDPLDAIDYEHTDKVLEDITVLLLSILRKDDVLKSQELYQVAHNLIPWFDYGENIDKSYFNEEREKLFADCTEIIFTKDFLKDQYLYLINYQNDYLFNDKKNIEQTCKTLFNQYEKWSERLALPDKQKSIMAKNVCDNIIYHRKKLGCSS